MDDGNCSSTPDEPGAVGHRLDQTRACPGCPATFACGVARPVDDPCWCTTVPLTTSTLDVLAATHDGCLCPSCLRAAAVRSP